MDLDLPPAALAMICQALNDALLVLLRREEIGMAQWTTIRVSVGHYRSGVGPTPLFHPPLLLLPVGVHAWRSRHEGRLKMVGHREDQMTGALARQPSNKLLPAKRG